MVSRDYNNNYVYAAYVDGVIKYVGRGKGDRLNHCTSGKSTCAKLNEALALGKSVTVKKLHTEMSEFDASLKEKELIEQYGDELFNIQNGGVVSQEVLLFKDLGLVTIEKVLFPATVITNKYTNISIKMSPATKILYMYLLTKIEDSPIVISQHQLAASCGISKRTVVDSINVLVNVGILEKEVIQSNLSLHSNKYTIHNVVNSSKFLIKSDKMNEKAGRTKEIVDTSAVRL